LHESRLWLYAQIGADRMRVLDLFSGLGGFSEAFVQAGDEVVRVENNPLLSEVPHTSMQNVLEVRDRLREFADRGETICLSSIDSITPGRRV
jgi:site-specific DNA-cytosine methylase